MTEERHVSHGYGGGSELHHRNTKEAKRLSIASQTALHMRCLKFRNLKERRDQNVTQHNVSGFIYALHILLVSLLWARFKNVSVEKTLSLAACEPQSKKTTSKPPLSSVQDVFLYVSSSARRTGQYKPLLQTKK